MKSIFNQLALVVLLIAGCKKSDSTDLIVKSSDKAITSFSFKVINNQTKLENDITCTISDSVITGIVPSDDLFDNRDSLIASFTYNGQGVSVNGEVAMSDTTMNNFKSTVTYVITAEDGSTKEYKVYLSYFTGFPIVYINTDNNAAIDSKETYVSGKLKVLANSYSGTDYEGTMQIRGRGNTTWDMPKKPYKIKLDSKSAILGMPADKEWVLIANYSDKSLMRNYLALETSKIMGLAYTPRFQYAEVVLNGEYVGNYLLGEQIKIAADRVNIKELGESDISASKVTGGYLLEIDGRLDETNWFYTTKGSPFTIKDPDAGVAEQNQYIQNYIQKTEDVIYSDSFSNAQSGYAAYIDASTFIKWYWVNELFKNNDATFSGMSVFLYKDRDSLLKMGPVWDFDIAAGNIDYNTTKLYTDWYTKNSLWLSRLFEDPVFASQAIKQWNDVKADIATLINGIDQVSEPLSYSEKANFKRWDILGLYVWPNAYVAGTYTGEVAYLKNWLQSRYDWINTHLSELMP